MFTFVHVLGIEGNLFGGVIDMNVENIDCFLWLILIIKLRPYVDYGVLNITFFLIHGHVVEENICACLLIFNIIYFLYIMIVINMIILNF